MHSMIISELRDPTKVKDCLDAGEAIEFRESDRVVEQIIPKTRAEEAEELVPPFKLPDFETRRRNLFGDRVFNAVDDFLEYRHGRY